MDDFSIPNLLFSLLVTILVYSFPIIILRYFFLGKPVSPKTAKKITIVYFIISMIIMTIIKDESIGPAIIFWSWVNYKILKSGYYTNELKNSIEESTNLINSNITNTNETINNEPIQFIFCRKCGAKLPIESKYCNKCGTEVIK